MAQEVSNWKNQEETKHCRIEFRWTWISGSAKRRRIASALKLKAIYMREFIPFKLKSVQIRTLPDRHLDSFCLSDSSYLLAIALKNCNSASFFFPPVGRLCIQIVFSDSPPNASASRTVNYSIWILIAVHIWISDRVNSSIDNRTLCHRFILINRCDGWPAIAFLRVCESEQLALKALQTIDDSQYFLSTPTSATEQITIRILIPFRSRWVHSHACAGIFAGRSWKTNENSSRECQPHTRKQLSISRRVFGFKQMKFGSPRAHLISFRCPFSIFSFGVDAECISLFEPFYLDGNWEAWKKKWKKENN